VRPAACIAGAMAAALAGGAAAGAQQPALPDWSGVWENVSGIHFTQPLVDGKPAAPNPPPLNAEYQAKYDAVLASARAGKPINDPTANCVWPGTPRVIVSPYPSEFLFTPGRVTIVYEYMSQVRRIRTDGSGHPPDLDPSYNGDSIGHWEGQTLVIETVATKAHLGLTSATRGPVPAHSPKLRILERIHLDPKDPDTLVDEIRLEDTDALAEPYRQTLTYKRDRTQKLLEFVCAENDRNPVDASGNTTFTHE